MKLLVLGGTEFLGRHFVEAALAAGHEVMLFNRGQSNSQLFPGLEKLRGDRYGSVDALRGRAWDAAIDTTGYTSAAVRATAELLAPSVAHYTFVSSMSVYSDDATPGQDESGPLAAWTGGVEDPGDLSTYGARKVLCEQAAEAAMPGRVLTLRPGMIVGPHDYTGRFAYWVRRMADGGEVLAPGRPDQPIQLIDARDLAAWMLEMISAWRTGIFNVTGPARPITMAEMLEACRAGTGGNASLTWVDEDFLLKNDVEPWTAMPFWLPAGYEGFFRHDISRALAAGLRFRPLTETVSDTYDWIGQRGREGLQPARAGLAAAGRIGLDREREGALLAGWRARGGEVPGTGQE